MLLGERGTKTFLATLAIVGVLVPILHLAFPEGSALHLSTYTMTLIGRLQESSKAALVFCYAERLARGEGFALHLVASEEPLPEDRREAARRVNAMVEKLVRECPSQYLWGYARFKRPAGAPPPPAQPAASAP